MNSKTIIILLSILVLVLVGYIVWCYYHRHKNDGDDTIENHTSAIVNIMGLAYTALNLNGATKGSDNVNNVSLSKFNDELKKQNVSLNDIQYNLGSNKNIIVQIYESKNGKKLFEVLKNTDLLKNVLEVSTVELLNMVPDTGMSAKTKQKITLETVACVNKLNYNDIEFWRDIDKTGNDPVLACVQKVVKENS